MVPMTTSEESQSSALKGVELRDIVKACLTASCLPQMGQFVEQLNKSPALAGASGKVHAALKNRGRSRRPLGHRHPLGGEGRRIYRCSVRGFTDGYRKNRDNYGPVYVPSFLPTPETSRKRGAPGAWLQSQSLCRRRVSSNRW